MEQASLLPLSRLLCLWKESRRKGCFRVDQINYFLRRLAGAPSRTNLRLMNGLQ